MVSRAYAALSDYTLWSVEVASGDTARVPLPEDDEMFPVAEAVATQPRLSRLFRTSGEHVSVMDVSGAEPVQLGKGMTGTTENSSLARRVFALAAAETSLVVLTRELDVPEHDVSGRPGALHQFRLPDVEYTRHQAVDGDGAHLAIAPGGHVACVTLMNSTQARILQLESGAPVATIELGAQAGRAALSLTGETAYITVPGGIAVVDTATAKVTDTWNRPAVDVAATPDGLWLYALTATPSLTRVFTMDGPDSAESIALPLPEDGSAFPGARVFVSPDNDYIAVLTTPTTVIMLDIQTFEPRSTATLPHPVTDLAFA